MMPTTDSRSRSGFAQRYCVWLCLFCLLLLIGMLAGCSTDAIKPAADADTQTKAANFNYCPDSDELRANVLKQKLLHQVDRITVTTPTENPSYNLVYGKDDHDEDQLLIISCKPDISDMKVIDTIAVADMYTKEQALDWLQQKGHPVTADKDARIELGPYSNHVLVWHVQWNEMDEADNRTVYYRYAFDVYTGEVAEAYSY